MRHLAASQASRPCRGTVSSKQLYRSIVELGLPQEGITKFGRQFVRRGVCNINHRNQGARNDAVKPVMRSLRSLEPVSLPLTFGRKHPACFGEGIKVRTQISVSVKETRLPDQTAGRLQDNRPLTKSSHLPMPGIAKKGFPSLAPGSWFVTYVAHDRRVAPDFREPLKILGSHRTQRQARRVYHRGGSYHALARFLCLPRSADCGGAL